MQAIESLKEQVSKLSSTDFLNLIEEECAKRKVTRDKVMGTNDIEINKIHLLLTDQIWMKEIFVLLHNGEYRGFKLNKEDAEESIRQFSNGTGYKREIVDLRDIY